MLSVLSDHFNNKFASLKILPECEGKNERAEMCLAWLNNDQQSEEIR